MTMKLNALLVTLFLGWQSQATVLHTCESSSDVINRAQDEVCDMLVEASEKCFGDLQEFMGDLPKAKKISQKEYLSRTQNLHETYESAIATVKAYSYDMEEEMCGDQKERIKVMVEFLEQDRQELSQILNRLKAEERGKGKKSK